MALTATDAAEALQDIGRYEERLTLRAAGLTHMVWGLITAALFVTYGYAETVLEGPSQALMAGLWLPWVAAGIFMTRSIWSHHSLSLHREGDGSLRVGLILTAVFLAIGGALYLGGLALGLVWSQGALMAVANGLFASGLGYMHHRQGQGATLFGAGIFMLIVAGFLAVWGVDVGQATAIAATAIGGGWFASGVITYLRG